MCAYVIKNNRTLFTMAVAKRCVIRCVHLTFVLCVITRPEVVGSEFRLSDNLYLPSSNLDALAQEICSDLEQNTTECVKRFLSPPEDVAQPTELRVMGRLKNQVMFSVTPSDVIQLVLLVPDDGEVLTSYMWPGDVNATTIIEPSTHYTFWTTALADNGTHSVWREGPKLRPWNLREQKEYIIQIDENYDNSSNVRVDFKWSSSGDVGNVIQSDTSYAVTNGCKNGPHIQEFVIIKAGQAPSFSASVSLGDRCLFTVAGPDGNGTRAYNIAPQPVEKISVFASPSRAGWDVRVRWPRPAHAPHRYLVVLRAAKEHAVNVSGDATEATFRGVSGRGLYNASVTAFVGRVGAHAFVRALFPSDVHKRNTLPHRTFLTIHLTSRLIILMYLTSYKEEWYMGVTGKLMLSGTILATGTEWMWRTVFANCTTEDVTSSVVPVLSSLLAVMLLVTTLVAAVTWCRRRRNMQLRHPYHEEDPVDYPKKLFSEATSDSLVTEDCWEVRPEKLLLHEVIGEGAFGVVRRGTLTFNKEVAVKMLKDYPSREEVRSFRAEMELMKSVGAHPHVVSLVGCCSGRRPLIVAEYCSRGDLLSYLRCSWDVMVSKRNVKYYNNNSEASNYRNDLFKTKAQEQSKLVVNKLYDLNGICDTELTYVDLLSFCRQIAMGMEFLSSNRVVHRDLAARNVLVTSDRTLKIADFGLSRDIYQENQYKQKGNGKMPVKWMALESLTHRIYTTQSDVWSFGVVAWEIVTLGAAPYPDVPPARLPRLLRAGYRMPRPAACCKQLYEVMVSCWRGRPRERPTFAELHGALDAMLHGACAEQYLALDLDADHDLKPDETRGRYTRFMEFARGKRRRGSCCEALRSHNHYSSPPAPVPPPVPQQPICI